MGIKHEIRTKDGSTRKLTLTPIKAIRYNCLECIGWGPSDVEDCRGFYCALYPYRFGTNPERKGVGKKKG
jgi:hypothetical protein